MTVNTAAGGKLYIGGVQSTRNPVLADFEEDSYIEVGEVENLGEFGDESESITFVSLSDARVRKFKGPRDAGTMAIVVGDDLTDEGQTAMEAAEQTVFDYNIKVELNDALTLAGTNSLHYFKGKVMSRRRNVGDARNIVRRNFAVAINSAPITVDPS